MSALGDSNRHIPVLLAPTLQALTPSLTGVDSPAFADATFGGGGHTAAVLSRFSDTHVLACDMDENAFDRARHRFTTELTTDRLRFYHGNFTTLPHSPWGPGWSAVLADLGYSSNQLEDPSYGMSFMTEGPLDMRLSRPPQGLSAWEVLNSTTDQQLGNLLKAYGEIHGAHRLAIQIHEALQRGEIVDSTLSLARWMDKKFPRRGGAALHPATLLFQALRIATNDELRALDQFLKNAILKLRPGGRLLVITFHSLEDRIVKHLCGESSGLKAVTRKPITADELETAANPRARSAKLRVYQRH